MSKPSRAITLFPFDVDRQRLLEAIYERQEGRRVGVLTQPQAADIVDNCLAQLKRLADVAYSLGHRDSELRPHGVFYAREHAFTGGVRTYLSVTAGRIHVCRGVPTPTLRRGELYLSFPISNKQA